MQDERATDQYETIETQTLVRDDGLRASPFGSCPWTSEEERARWSLVTEGYSVRNMRTGTRGIGRMPWKTREEAQAWIDARALRMREQAIERTKASHCEGLLTLLLAEQSFAQEEGIGSEVLEFRIQLRGKDGTTAELHTGDPCYDLDHRGSWGSGSFELNAETSEVKSALKSALEEAFDALTEDQESEEA